MAKFNCAGCQKEHEDSNWKHTTYEFEDGERSGWFCTKYFKPRSFEFVPDRIKQQRKEHYVDMIQPYKGGEPNQEFVEHYPEQSKKYFGEKTTKKIQKKVI